MADRLAAYEDTMTIERAKELAQADEEQASKLRNAVKAALEQMT